MHRFFIGIAIWLFVIAFNHVDKLFPVFTEFNLFSKTYKFVDPYTSEDIIWTIVQKFNVVIYSIGMFFIISGILSLKHNEFSNLKPILKKYSFACLLIICLFYIYQTVDAIIYWIEGFNTTMFWGFATAIIMSLVAVVYFFLVGFTAYKKNVNKDLAKKLNEKIDDFSINFHELVEDYKDIEAIASEMKSEDLIAPWKIVITSKTRDLYLKASEYLQGLETEKIIHETGSK